MAGLAGGGPGSEYATSPSQVAITDAWLTSATGSDFLNSYQRYFGSDVFAQGNMGYRDPGDPIINGGLLSDMSGGGEHFVYDLMQVLGSSKDATGEPLPFDASDVVRLAKQLWADPDLRSQYGLFGNSVIMTRLRSELSATGVIGKRGRKTQYATVGEEVAAMNPIARENYYREQAIRAEEDFYQQHQGIYGLYQQYFGLGRHQVTQQQILDVAAHGNDTASWNDYIRTLPSHVAGINIGAYFDIRQLADKTSQAIYGHDANDQVVKDLFDRKLNVKEGVQFYFDQLPLQPGKNIEPIAYNMLWKSAREHTQAIWNQEPSPLDLNDMWVKHGSPGQLVPATQAQESAKTGAPDPAAEKQQNAA